MTFRVNLVEFVNKLRADKLFIAFVALPTLIAIAYFGFIASDVFISESQYVVRSPEKPSLSGLGVLFKNVGYANASEEENAANDYIETRDALAAINAAGAVARAYGANNISIFNRYNPRGWSPLFEQLFSYMKSKIKVDANSTTGVTVLTVRAFSPEDAHRFNEQLLELAEALVNRLNARARADLIRSATDEVTEASDRLQKSAQALAYYRDHNRVVDPGKQAEIQLQMISKLQDQLIASRAERAELQKSASDSESLPVLDARIASLARQVADESGRLAGGGGSLAAQATNYQHLVVVNELAAKELAASMGSLDQAMIEARRKQSYVERIAQPSLPDYPEEPRRLQDILATFVVGLILWGVARMLVASILEHVD